MALGGLLHGIQRRPFFYLLLCCLFKIHCLHSFITSASFHSYSQIVCSAMRHLAYDVPQKSDTVVQIYSHTIIQSLENTVHPPYRPASLLNHANQPSSLPPPPPPSSPPTHFLPKNPPITPQPPTHHPSVPLPPLTNPPISLVTHPP